MKRLIAVLVLAALALMPAAATAKSRAKVFRGTFQFVGVEADYVSGKFGKAQLVDNRRDKLSVHVRGLMPRTKYAFRLIQGARCDGTADERWRYRPLKTNRSGNGNATARSHTFRARKDARYSVAVYTRSATTGQPERIVLCADLYRNGKHGSTKPDDKGKSKDKPDKGKPAGKPDDAPGKSEEAPRGKAKGHDDDKDRGKSDEAPRGKGKGKGPKDRD